MPKIPETLEVMKLIGICKSKLEPKAFTKNNNNAPTIIFINSCPIHLRGRSGAPTNKRIKINPPNIEKISIGSNIITLFHFSLVINMKGEGK